MGTTLVTGSGAPTANMVYKLVELEGLAVQKRSTHKESLGGRKAATRVARATGTIVEEVVHAADLSPVSPRADAPTRALVVPLVRGGEPVADTALATARDRVAAGLRSLPWEGLKLSAGDPALPLVILGA